MELWYISINLLSAGVDLLIHLLLAIGNKVPHTNSYRKAHLPSFQSVVRLLMFHVGNSPCNHWIITAFVEI